MPEPPDISCRTFMLGATATVAISARGAAAPAATATGWTSNNLAFDPVRNPYDQSRIPGGSRGGTAAAIAARAARWPPVAGSGPP